jgi:DDE domain
MTIAAMAGASCAGLPVHSRHAATAGACALTLSVFASLGFAPRHALSTLFAKISQQVFDFFEFVLVQTRRNKRAALKLMRKLLKKYGFVPDKLVTDDLRSYGAAASDLGITKRHERGRWRNNRAENSHQPTRRRERKMQGFKNSGSAQRFLSTHAATYNTFNVQRHLISARIHRAFRASAMEMWRAAVAAPGKVLTANGGAICA